MIIKKALLNQIERIIQQKLGMNPDAAKIKRLENDVRTLQGNMSRMQNMVDSKPEKCCGLCKCKVGKKDA